MQRDLWPLQRIVSGGQTGVDRAALDVARDLRIRRGGWCPRGRRAEDGPIPPCYELNESLSDEYPQRTEWNVRDSDGTLILTRGSPRGGTALTIRLARKLDKPCLVLDLTQEPTRAELRQWVEINSIRVLNVAGPRESTQKGIYHQARRVLGELFRV
jgi:hypothetical protein